MSASDPKRTSTPDRSTDHSYLIRNLASIDRLASWKVDEVTNERELPVFKNKRILVVEDEWLIGDMVAEMLVGMGCVPVGPAGDVSSALDFANRPKLDAALLDMKLGDESIIQVADVLRKRDVPFAFISGYSRLMLPRHQDAPLLQKPFTHDELRACLQLLFGGDVT